MSLSKITGRSLCESTRLMAAGNAKGDSSKGSGGSKTDAKVAQ